MKHLQRLSLGLVVPIILLNLMIESGLADEPLVGHSTPTLSGCQVFPVDNIWNTPIDTMPLDANSDAYIANIGANTSLHADFGAGVWPPGSDSPIGIPFVAVPAGQALVPIAPVLYADESDPGPYPIPSDAPIEGGPSGDGDRHVLVVRQGECKLYELYRAFPNNDAANSWQADSGAIFDLNSNALRPDTWTSADAAGLPILPGLVRYEDVEAGAINHAIRFTVVQTRRDYVWPARHFASSSTDPNRPPMGQRFRLKADFVIDDSFSEQGQIILKAMKKYGIILADNGSNWYISGAPNENWDNAALNQDFDRVTGADFEAIDMTSLRLDPDSGQAQQLVATPANQAVDAGAVTTYTVSLLANDNITGSLTLLSPSPSPSLTLSLSPTTITTLSQATLTVTNTHSGPLASGVFYTIPLTATGNGITQTANVTLLVGGARVYLPVVFK